MNITAILKAATRQGLAEVQDVWATALDVRHLIKGHNVADCMKVHAAYAPQPTVVETIASKTVIRVAMALNQLLHDEPPASGDAFSELSMEEAMAFLNAWMVSTKEDEEQ